MVFITITLLCIYVKILWSWQSSHGRGPEVLDSGMEFTAIDMANWNMYISSQCILLPSDWWGDPHWYPAWPYGVSNQINWLVCNDLRSTNLALNSLHLFNMTESYRYYTILHCITKPCRDHRVLAQTIRQSVLYCNAGSDWLWAYTE